MSEEPEIPEVDSAVIVGDIHIGWEKSNLEEFKDFLSTRIYTLEPDVFIINGDLLELWRSSYSKVMVEFSDVFTLISEVHESGIDVIPLVGNHDWRMIETSREIVTKPDSLWNFREQYPFDCGGEEFIASHGHEADSLNRGRTQNTLFCLTTEDVGEKMADTWENIVDRPILGSVMDREPLVPPFTRVAASKDGPLLNRPSLRAFTHINNPDILSEDESEGRYERIVKIHSRLYDRTVIGAHTHIQEERENYYNPGSWTTGSSGYVHIEDGNVDIENY